MKFYKMFDDVVAPKYATEGAACFDLCAYLKPGQLVGYFNDNTKADVSVLIEDDSDSLCVLMPPQSRLLIPTGLIFEIETGHSVRLHPRSGLSLKSGISLANCEGVIDSDYREEVKIILYNSSYSQVLISNGDRICQGEVVEDARHFLLAGKLSETTEQPTKVGDRDGGFGSTGVKAI